MPASGIADRTGFGHADLCRTNNICRGAALWFVFWVYAYIARLWVNKRTKKGKKSELVIDGINPCLNLSVIA